MTMPAPTVIAASATLNAGQCQPKAWTATKSATAPQATRSQRLPSAPPRMSARPAHSHRRSAWRHSIRLTTAEAASATAMKNAVCHPGASARKLNAAPLLYTSTRLKKGVTSTDSPARSQPIISHLLRRSAATTSAAARNQGAALGMPARLARAVQVALAARAQPRGVDVGAVVPAAVALRMAACLDQHRGRRALDALELPARSDEDEAQVVSEPRQRLEQRAGGRDVKLRSQRGADFLQLALFLDLLVGEIAGLAYVAPGIHDLVVQTVIREQVKDLLEHAGFLAARQHLPGLLRGEAQDRRHHAHQALRDVPQGRLRRAPRKRSCAAGVEPVLEDIQVEGAELLGAERLQLLRDEMELEARVVGLHLVLQARRQRERVAVDLDHLRHGHRVPGRVEIGGVGEEKAQRVADAPVEIGRASCRER